MMKKEKKVNEKPYSALMFLKDFVVLEIVVIYVVIMIGDVISTVSELPSLLTRYIPALLTRYIPIVIATLLTTLFIIKSKAKNCKISEEKEVKKYMIIAPIIVAVIIVAYGLYSVESNLKKIDTSSMGLFFSQEYIEEFLKEIAISARISWFMIATTYLATAEAIVLVKRKNISKNLKNDFVEEPLMMGQSEFVSMQNDIEMPEQNNDAVNSIKWNL